MFAYLDKVNALNELKKHPIYMNADTKVNEHVQKHGAFAKTNPKKDKKRVGI